MIRLTFALISFALIAVEAFGTEPVTQLEPGSPADVGMDAGRLDRAVSIVRHAVEDDEIPGAVNGGAATAHGKSLTKTGRDQLRQFYQAGGSYCGSCAGSFLSGRNVDTKPGPRLGYLNIFPFNTLNTGIKKTRVGHQIPDDSPLLRYRDFGGDNAVADIYHNNGNWLRVDEGMAGVEVLARYDHPGHKVDGGAAIWAYRSNEQTGRILNIGCHPESGSDGELLSLTEACFLHALAGTGTSQLKGTLEYDKPRKMDRDSGDRQPALTRIGDRQYHHFAFDVPDDERPVTIKLSSREDVDLHLFLSSRSLAFCSQATVFDVRPGSSKTIQRQLTPGQWYVSVYCATSVETINDPDSGFHRYIGDGRCHIPKSARCVHES
jgi:glutamine amidotransferase PdxT